MVFAVLVMGLAMGSLSTLSLQFNRQQVESLQAEMAARGAIAQLLAKLRQFDAGREMNPLKPEPFDVANFFVEEFKGKLEFQEGPYQAVVHFETSQDGFSTDNLGGDAASVGWPDSDDVARVPPFALDVIVNVKGPTTARRYRVGLKRIWPFALYSARGPIQMMAIPGAGPGSQSIPTIIKGDVYTSWQGNEASGGAAAARLQGYGLGLLDDPSKVLANLEARAGYHPAFVNTDLHMMIGSEVARNSAVHPEVLGASKPEKKFYRYLASSGALRKKLGDTETSPIFNVTADRHTDEGNLLEGDFLCSHDLNENIPPLVLPGSDHIGEGKLVRGPVLDPLKDLLDGGEMLSSSFVLDSRFQDLELISEADEELLENEEGFPVMYSSVPPESFIYDDDDEEDPHDTGQKPPILLREDLVLTETENSTGGPLSSHYRIRGSVSNRRVAYVNEGPNAGLYVKEMKAGMRLQNVVLFISGDLDLSSTILPEVGSADKQQFDIVGSGATLIVGGKLILGNATINAEDRGFVLYAREIVLKGGGTFLGLMIAEDAITILSQQNALNIKGSLLCAGYRGITLKGTNLEHDANYLKSINGGGDFAIVSWKKL